MPPKLVRTHLLVLANQSVWLRNWLIYFSFYKKSPSVNFCANFSSAAFWIKRSTSGTGCKPFVNQASQGNAGRAPIAESHPRPCRVSEN